MHSSTTNCGAFVCNLPLPSHRNDVFFGSWHSGSLVVFSVITLKACCYQVGRVWLSGTSNAVKGDPHQLQSSMRHFVRTLCSLPVMHAAQSSVFSSDCWSPVLDGRTGGPTAKCLSATTVSRVLSNCVFLYVTQPIYIAH